MQNNRTSPFSFRDQVMQILATLGLRVLPSGRLMLPGISVRGDWEAVTSYGADDIVSYGGRLYVCISGISGDPPDIDVDHWLVLAEIPQSVAFANLGDGEPVMAGEAGGVVSFKTLKAGNNVQLASDGNTITISATGMAAGIFIMGAFFEFTTNPALPLQLSNAAINILGAIFGFTFSSNFVLI